VALVDGNELGPETEPYDRNLEFISHNMICLGEAEAALPRRAGWKRIHTNEIRGFGRIKAPSSWIFYDTILT
jgi:hypothetical protein